VKPLPALIIDLPNGRVTHMLPTPYTPQLVCRFIHRLLPIVPDGATWSVGWVA
jgi:hypothetical protein